MKYTTWKQWVTTTKSVFSLISFFLKMIKCFELFQCFLFSFRNCCKKKKSFSNILVRMRLIMTSIHTYTSNFFNLIYNNKINWIFLILICLNYIWKFKFIFKSTLSNYFPFTVENAESISSSLCNARFNIIWNNAILLTRLIGNK